MSSLPPTNSPEVAFVLCVESDPAEGERLHRALARMPLPVRLARHPDEALEELESGLCAVVIADFHLPRLNGVQLLERARHQAPETVRILCCRDLPHEVALRAVNRAEIYRLLPKPWEPGLLQQTVLVAAQHYQVSQENRQRWTALESAGTWKAQPARPSSLPSDAAEEKYSKTSLDRSGGSAGGHTAWGGLPQAESRGPKASPCPPKPSSSILPRPSLPGLGPERPASLIDRGTIGEGGMAVVYRVFDQKLQRELAEKRLHEAFRYERQLVAHLVAEAQLTAQLEHPHIVPVHDLVRDHSGTPAFTMKLVQGTTLQDLVAEQPPAERTPGQLFQLLQVFLRVCDAVAFAHSRGVIHQDLKPSNIMVGSYGEVYVMDWGIARRLPQPGSAETESTSSSSQKAPAVTKSRDGIVGVCGTPGFLAPEQALGYPKGLDHRADIFSLGAILYSILTGHPPYDGETPQETLIRTVTEPPKPPAECIDGDLPPQLCTIALRALSRQPEDRPVSAIALKQEIEAFLQSGWQYRTRVFAKGQLIVRQGDPATEAFIIVQGQCLAFKTQGPDEIPLTEMGPGDAFGETALLTRSCRTANVRALTDVRAVVVGQDQMEQELGEGFFLGPVLRGLAQRFHRRDEQASQLERQLQQTQWTIWILRYLLTHGTRPAGSRPEVPWSELRQLLAEHFEKSSAEVTHLIEGLSSFGLDLERDRLWLADDSTAPPSTSAVG